MNYTLFTATGCTRCKIVKGYMNERGIAFVERDMKADGKADFQKFYATNRKAVYRGPDGIEFPIFFDGDVIRQGIGEVIAHLHSGSKLDGFVGIGTLHKEWVNGFHVSGGNPAYAEEFLAVLRYLKGKNMKIQVDTNGKNSQVLKKVLDERLADSVIMDVVGPVELYSQILGEKLEIQDVEKSIALVPQFSQYQFQTTVAPIIGKAGGTPAVRYMTPEEVGETAGLIEKVTGSKKHPYKLRLFEPEKAADKRLKEIEALPVSALFSYRSAARVHQVLSDIEKV